MHWFCLLNSRCAFVSLYSLRLKFPTAVRMDFNKETLYNQTQYVYYLYLICTYVLSAGYCVRVETEYKRYSDLLLGKLNIYSKRVGRLICFFFVRLEKAG
jgi:hypothetical protein